MEERFSRSVTRPANLQLSLVPVFEKNLEFWRSENQRRKRDPHHIRPDKGSLQITRAHWKQSLYFFHEQIQILFFLGEFPRYRPRHPHIFKTLLRYPLAREGVYAPVRHAFLAHAMQKVSIIVGLTALRLAFFLGYE